MFNEIKLKKEDVRRWKERNVKLQDEIYIKSLISTDTPTIVECGSNDGRTAKGFLATFPEARLFCFEPDPRNIAKFVRRGYTSQTKLYGVAVCDRDGMVQLFQSYGRTSDKPKDYQHTDSSSIKDVSKLAEKLKLSWLKFKPPIEVEAVRLDTWLKSVDVDIIDFMWVDIEGAENDMIAGGTETMKRTHYLYTEYNDDGVFGGGSDSEGILKLLPDFELVKKWKCDMLLHNKKMKM